MKHKTVTLPELILAVLFILPVFIVILIEMALCWVDEKIR